MWIVLVQVRFWVTMWAITVIQELVGQILQWILILVKVLVQQVRVTIAVRILPPVGGAMESVDWGVTVIIIWGGRGNGDLMGQAMQRPKLASQKPSCLSAPSSSCWTLQVMPSEHLHSFRQVKIKSKKFLLCLIHMYVHMLCLYSYYRISSVDRGHCYI